MIFISTTHLTDRQGLPLVAGVLMVLKGAEDLLMLFQGYGADMAGFDLNAAWEGVSAIIFTLIGVLLVKQVVGK